MPALQITDVVCFARDAAGDLEFPLRGASGVEAVAIGARTRASLFMAEWFLNPTVGVAYLPDGRYVKREQAILGRPFDPIRVRSELMREILTTPGAVDIPTFRSSFDSDARRLRVSFRVMTIWGLETSTVNIERES